MVAQVRAEERLFALVLSLLATEQGLTKQQIFATVRGYEPESNNGAQLESLERKFERDKSDLRELGIPLETLDSPEAPGDNQLSRYRIPRDEYVFPSDIRFSSAELALLNLAGEVWREGTVSTVSHRALTKLRSLDVEPDAPILGYVPRLRVREAVFDDLNRSIEHGLRISFDYLKPGATSVEPRDITPFALGLVEGRWHVLGFDHGRNEERTFLLSRIHGKPAKSSAEPAIAPADAAERLVAGLRELTARQRARLLVQLGSTSASELSNRPGAEAGTEQSGWRELTVPYLDALIFAEELAGSGPEVRVLEPATLATQVRSILHRAELRHGGDR